MTINGIGNVGATAIENNDDYALDGPAGERAPSILREGMSQLMTSGDPGAAMAALMVAIGRTERKSNQAIQGRAEALQESEESKQLDELQQKATMALVSGAVSGAATAAGGAVSAASSFQSINADKVKVEVGDMKVEHGDVTATAQKAVKLDQQGALSRGATDYKLGADLGAGASKITTAILDEVAAQHDASATAHAHAASHAKSAVDDAHADVQDASRLIGKALDFYKEYTSTKDQTAQIAARRA